LKSLPSGLQKKTSAVMAEAISRSFGGFHACGRASSLTRDCKSASKLSQANWVESVEKQVLN
jgi:hypothetical protein